MCLQEIKAENIGQTLSVDAVATEASANPNRKFWSYDISSKSMGLTPCIPHPGTDYMLTLGGGKGQPWVLQLPKDECNSDWLS